ncbi:hypothetical protein KFK09_028706 [Dendrobium nobile]|uniref:Aminotransferase-like plant mobile domain-containing protein n=1 Tax=Dendrobium nobile TaxID=94219 RepID=A0A8T3A3T9_DENNO|nr:hypothetical protein KFK09_028706 [Dendrobium nobile]
MAHEPTRPRRHRVRKQPSVDEATYGPAPADVHPTIACLRGKHRAAHPDQGTILERASHMLMVQDWSIECPRFIAAIRTAGLHCIRQLMYIKLDHHLLTALVERWSPQTNTFHLAVGEMSITLQDVAMIMGLQIDGPPLVGPSVVGLGKRWNSWPDCCNDLLGSHPDPNLMYHDPLNPQNRWNEEWVRDMPVGNIKIYRNELDGLLQSQVIWEPYGPSIHEMVAKICLAGRDIWRARVPLISWKRVEWHLPDRVIRQFGFSPTTDVQPMDPNYVRVDGRGKADMDWMIYHHLYIMMWEGRRGVVIHGVQHHEGEDQALKEYLHWYRSWASLYLLQPPIEPPKSYYARAPVERMLRNYLFETNEMLQRFYGQDDESTYHELQQTIDRIGDLNHAMRTQMYLEDTRYHSNSREGSSFPQTTTEPHASPFEMADAITTCRDWGVPQETITQDVQQPEFVTHYPRWPTYVTNWSPFDIGSTSQFYTPPPE